MQNNQVLISKTLILRPVALNDVNSDYVTWLNDPEVNRFMETRFRAQGRSSIEDYVKRVLSTPDVYFFAMVDPTTGDHIGNIKLSVILPHKRGDISLFIGKRRLWGTGLGTKAIYMIKDFGLTQLGLHKLTAGCYANNLASAKAFEKAGFFREAVLRQEYFCEGQWVDRYCYAFIASQ